MPDPKLEAQKMRDAGASVDDIAEQFEVNKATVYRWLKDVAEGPGPTERRARALVADWNQNDQARQLQAEQLIGLAVIADVGRSRNANGAERNAGVAALKEIGLKLAELGQQSGAEELIRALRDL